MKLDVRSSILGAAFGALGVLSLGFQVPAGSSPTTLPWSHPTLTITGPVQVEGVPTPEQMMRITQGQSFVVPAGHRFVVTGLGGNGPENNLDVTVIFDGVGVLAATVTSTTITAGGAPVAPVPPGLVATEGTIITLQDNHPVVDGVVLGYLAEN